MPLPSLNRSKRVAASPEEERAHESPDVMEVEEAPEVPEAPSQPTPTEPDEFDIAAEVVKNSASDPSEASADASADTAAETSAEDQAPSTETPEEEQAKSADEIAMEEYRRATGASPEQAQTWLAAAKAAQSRQPQPPEQDKEQRQQQQQRPMAPTAGAAFGALIGGLGGGLGSGIRGIKRGVADATNAALRGTGVRPAAGLTPEVIKSRLFNRWHQDYEAGVKGMERSMADLVKTAAAYNQLVRTSAPGRELEKIAKSRGTDMKTLMSQITDGSFDDADAKAAADALRSDPHVKNAWSKFEKSVEGYGENLEKVRHNMTQLVNNKSERIDVEVESTRLEEIHGKRSKVEQPLELPANPISDAKADGKSKQKSVWEQFVEMGQNGLNFLQGLFEKVANFVASKFGR